MKQILLMLGLCIWSGSYAQTSMQYVAAGDAKDSLKDYKGAMADYSRAIDLDTTNITAWLRRAVIRHVLLQTSASQDDLAVAYRLTPRDAATYVYRAQVKIRFSAFFGALGDYREALKLGLSKSDKYEVYTQMGDAEFQTGNDSAAAADFSLAVGLDSTKARAYSMRAEVSMKQRNISAAIRDYSRAIQLDGHDPISYVHRGIAWMKISDTQAAMTDFNTAILIDAKCKVAYFNRGVLRQDLGQKEDACADFKMAWNLGFGRGKSMYEKYCADQGKK